MASVIVLPGLYLVIKIAFDTVPALGWMAAGLALLYLVAVISAVLTNTSLKPLREPLVAAAFFFSTSIFVCLILPDHAQENFRIERVPRVLTEIFSVKNAFDVVGAGFAALLIYTVLGSLIALVYGQITEVGGYILRCLGSALDRRRRTPRKQLPTILIRKSAIVLHRRGTA